MSNLIEKHFEKILNADISVLGDYDENIVSIVRVGGAPETLNIDGVKALMKQLLSIISFSEAEILVNRTTASNGVLTIKSSFAPFLSYACIAKNCKIAGATLYIYQPSPLLITLTVKSRSG